MNINYLLSVIDLYILKESNDNLIISVYSSDTIKVECSYATSSLNKTFIKVDKSQFFENINYLFNKIQSNLNIKNESFDNDIYKIVFDNNREISFINFNDNDLKIIRSNFNNLSDNFSFNKVEINDKINYNEIYKENTKRSVRYSLGFTSFITIFLTSIWFLDILLIALWIFKIVR